MVVRLKTNDFFSFSTLNRLFVDCLFTIPTEKTTCKPLLYNLSFKLYPVLFIFYLLSINFYYVCSMFLLWHFIRIKSASAYTHKKKKCLPMMCVRGLGLKRRDPARTRGIFSCVYQHLQIFLAKFKEKKCSSLRRTLFTPQILKFDMERDRFTTCPFPEN